MLESGMPASQRYAEYREGMLRLLAPQLRATEPGPSPDVARRT